MDQVFELLDLSLGELWEARRVQQPGLPVFKTVAKFLSGSEGSVSDNVGRKLDRHLPLGAAAMQLSASQEDQGYCIPAVAAWAALVEKYLFHSHIAAGFWLDFMRELSALNGPGLYEKAAGLERMKVYARSSLVDRFGCPISRERLEPLLQRLDGAESLDQNQEVQQLVGADRLATSLRIAAWVMADWQVANWELSVRDGSEAKILCHDLVPYFMPETGSWSHPIGIALEKLATLAGWHGKQKPITFLGNLWAATDGCIEATSRIRLLRNWFQLKPGRPTFEMLVRLVRTCRNEEARLKGVEIEDGTADDWFSASIFRVAEALSHLVRNLVRRGFPTEVIISTMGVYETEYRIARQMLGRPIQQ